jgi:type IX secretion system PorP/SprF family membrane protein
MNMNRIASKQVALAFALSIGISVTLKAQDRSGSYTNTLNDFTRNAAYTGSADHFTAALETKWMTANLDGFYQSLLFGAHTRITETDAIGIKVLADNQGALRNVNIELNYAKRLKLAEGQFLSLGANAGFLQTSINQSAFTSFVDVSDPTINNGYFNQLRFTGGFGALYKYKKTIEVGFSMPMLATGNEKINTNMILNASYAWKASEESKWKVVPMLVYYNFSQKSMLDAGVKGSWNDFISVSAGYRSNGSLITSLMVNTKGFSVGYGFNYSTGNVNQLYMSTNEIMLAVSLVSVGKKHAEVNEKNLSVIENRLSGVKEQLQELAGSADKLSSEEIKKKMKSANSDLQNIMKEYKTDNVESLKAEIQELNTLMDEIEKKVKSKDSK